MADKYQYAPEIGQRISQIRRAVEERERTVGVTPEERAQIDAYVNQLESENFRRSQEAIRGAKSEKYGERSVRDIVRQTTPGERDEQGRLVEGFDTESDDWYNTRPADYFRRLVTGYAGMLPSVPKALGMGLATLSGEDWEDSRLYQMGQGAEDFLNARVPTSDKHDDEWGAHAASGVGSGLGALYAGGGFSRAANAATKLRRVGAIAPFGTAEAEGLAWEAREAGDPQDIAMLKGLEGGVMTSLLEYPTLLLQLGTLGKLAESGVGKAMGGLTAIKLGKENLKRIFGRLAANVVGEEGEELAQGLESMFVSKVGGVTGLLSGYGGANPDAQLSDSYVPGVGALAGAILGAPGAVHTYQADKEARAQQQEMAKRDAAERAKMEADNERRAQVRDAFWSGDEAQLRLQGHRQRLEEAYGKRYEEAASVEELTGDEATVPFQQEEIPAMAEHAIDAATKVLHEISGQGLKEMQAEAKKIRETQKRLEGSTDPKDQLRMDMISIILPEVEQQIEALEAGEAKQEDEMKLQERAILNIATDPEVDPEYLRAVWNRLDPELQAKLGDRKIPMKGGKTTKLRSIVNSAINRRTSQKKAADKKAEKDREDQMAADRKTIADEYLQRISGAQTKEDLRRVVSELGGLPMGSARDLRPRFQKAIDTRLKQIEVAEKKAEREADAKLKEGGREQAKALKAGEKGLISKIKKAEAEKDLGVEPGSKADEREQAKWRKQFGKDLREAAAEEKGHLEAFEKAEAQEEAETREAVDKVAEAAGRQLDSQGREQVDRAEEARVAREKAEKEAEREAEKARKKTISDTKQSIRKAKKVTEVKELRALAEREGFLEEVQEQLDAAEAKAREQADKNRTAALRKANEKRKKEAKERRQQEEKERAELRETELNDVADSFMGEVGRIGEAAPTADQLKTLERLLELDESLEKVKRPWKASKTARRKPMPLGRIYDLLQKRFDAAQKKTSTPKPAPQPKAQPKPKAEPKPEVVAEPTPKEEVKEEATAEPEAVEEAEEASEGISDLVDTWMETSDDMFPASQEFAEDVLETKFTRKQYEQFLDELYELTVTEHTMGTGLAEDQAIQIVRPEYAKAYEATYAKEESEVEASPADEVAEPEAQAEPEAEPDVEPEPEVAPEPEVPAAEDADEDIEEEEYSEEEFDAKFDELLEIYSEGDGTIGGGLDSEELQSRSRAAFTHGDWKVAVVIYQLTGERAYPDQTFAAEQERYLDQVETFTLGDMLRAEKFLETGKPRFLEITRPEVATSKKEALEKGLSNVPLSQWLTVSYQAHKEEFGKEWDAPTRNDARREWVIAMTEARLAGQETTDIEAISDQDKLDILQSMRKIVELTAGKERNALKRQVNDTAEAMGYDVNWRQKKNVDKWFEKRDEGPLNSPDRRFEKLPPTIEVDGVERPTTNSEGQQIHPTREGVENFWRWFGDSKVVDEQGRPKVVYHGSRDPGFTEFDGSKSRPDFRGGIFFLDRPGFRLDSGPFGPMSEFETGPNAHAAVYPAYLRVENPVVQGEKTSILVGIDKALKEGRDGVISTTNAETGTTEFVVFEGTQVKSATGNTGAFSPAETRIDNAAVSPQSRFDIPIDLGDLTRHKKAYRNRYHDPTTKKILDAYEGDAKLLVQQLMENDQLNDMDRRGLELFSAFNEQLEKHGKALNVRFLVRPRGFERVTSEKGGPSSAGWYEGGEHRVTLLIDVDENGNMSTRSRVAVHELVHAATSIALRNENLLDARGKAAVREIRNFWKALKRSNHRNATKHYGLTNEHEMLAEAFSNPEFQNFLRETTLKSLNYKPGKGLWGQLKSAWDLIVSSVSKMLGGKNLADFNALEYVIGFSEEVSGAQSRMLESGRFDKRRGDRIRNMFAGERAKGKDRFSLAAAAYLEAEGLSPKQIRKKTGWFRGKDGKWRFEIDDSQAEFSRSFDSIPETKLFEDPEEDIKLGDILNHPALFEAYPELKDIKIVKQSGLFDFFRGLQGWYNPRNDEIGITPYADSPFSTILHEVQHVIQRIEGFARGGSASDKLIDSVPKEEIDSIANDAMVKALGEAHVAKRLAELLANVAEDEEFLARAKETRRLDEQVTKAQADLRSVEYTHGYVGDKWEEAYKAYRKAATKLNEAIDDLKLSLGWADGLPFGTRGHEYDYNDSISSLVDNFTRIRYSDKSIEEIIHTTMSAAGQSAAENIEEANAIKRGDRETILKILKRSGGLHELYSRLAGEVEARNTQRRASFTDEMRRDVDPEATEDADRDSQILKFTDDESRMEVGEGAANANLKTLEDAKAAVSRGADPAQVYAETGWYRGRDDRWRFSIDDRKARLNLKAMDNLLEKAQGLKTESLRGAKTKLIDLMSHAELFQAYPWMRQITVEVPASGLFNMWLDGSYDPKSRKVTISPSLVDPWPVLFHELQHAVQEHEGHATGGSPATVIQNLPTDTVMSLLEAARARIDEMAPGALRDELDEIASRAIRAYTEGSEDQVFLDEVERVIKLVASPNSLYDRLAGEVEARYTQDQLSGRAPRAYPPTIQSRDVETSEQLVITPKGEVSALTSDEAYSVLVGDDLEVDHSRPTLDPGAREKKARESELKRLLRGGKGPKTRFKDAFLEADKMVYYRPDGALDVRTTKDSTPQPGGLKKLFLPMGEVMRRLGPNGIRLSKWGLSTILYEQELQGKYRDDNLTAERKAGRHWNAKRAKWLGVMASQLDLDKLSRELSLIDEPWAKQDLKAVRQARQEIGFNPADYKVDWQGDLPVFRTSGNKTAAMDAVAHVINSWHANDNSAKSLHERVALQYSQERLGKDDDGRRIPHFPINLTVQALEARYESGDTDKKLDIYDKYTGVKQAEHGSFTKGRKDGVGFSEVDWSQGRTHDYFAAAAKEIMLHAFWGERTIDKDGKPKLARDPRRHISEVVSDTTDPQFAMKYATIITGVIGRSQSDPRVLAWVRTLVTAQYGMKLSSPLQAVTNLTQNFTMGSIYGLGRTASTIIRMIGYRTALGTPGLRGLALKSNIHEEVTAARRSGAIPSTQELVGKFGGVSGHALSSREEKVQTFARKLMWLSGFTQIERLNNYTAAIVGWKWANNLLDAYRKGGKGKKARVERLMWKVLRIDEPTLRAAAERREGFSEREEKWIRQMAARSVHFRSDPEMNPSLIAGEREAMPIMLKQFKTFPFNQIYQTFQIHIDEAMRGNPGALLTLLAGAGLAGELLKWLKEFFDERPRESQFIDDDVSKGKEVPKAFKDRARRQIESLSKRALENIAEVGTLGMLERPGDLTDPIKLMGPVVGSVFDVKDVAAKVMEHPPDLGLYVNEAVWLMKRQVTGFKFYYEQMPRAFTKNETATPATQLRAIAEQTHQLAKLYSRRQRDESKVAKTFAPQRLPRRGIYDSFAEDVKREILSMDIGAAYEKKNKLVFRIMEEEQLSFDSAIERAEQIIGGKNPLFLVGTDDEKLDDFLRWISMARVKTPEYALGGDALKFATKGAPTVGSQTNSEVMRQVLFTKHAWDTAMGVLFE